MIRKRRPLQERFEEKFTRNGPNECWPWVGACHDAGYGRIRLGGMSRMVPATHVSYELYVGPVPSGMFVCHACDNPKCVNPNHLWLGTHNENMQDMTNKGRSPRGGAKLTYDQVKEIRSRLLCGVRGRAIAREFGVSDACVSLIKSGKNWQPHLLERN